jgi:hypothetical protein
LIDKRIEPAGNRLVRHARDLAGEAGTLQSEVSDFLTELRAG